MEPSQSQDYESTPNIPTDSPTVIDYQPHHASRKKLLWGIACLTIPTILILLSIILLYTLALISISPGESISKSILSAVLSIVSQIGFYTWLPGIIAGIILLKNRKRTS